MPEHRARGAVCKSLAEFRAGGGIRILISSMSVIFAERILRARAVKCRMRNWFEPSRFAAVEAHGKAANFAQGIHINVGLCPRSGQSSRGLNMYRYGKCRRPRIRPEHFNRKGFQTLRRSVWKSRIRPRCSAPRSRQSLAEFRRQRRRNKPKSVFFGDVYNAPTDQYFIRLSTGRIRPRRFAPTSRLSAN